MSRIEQQPVWVLHRHPWRETSMLAELFSRDHGRLGVVARGARGAGSAWRGLLEPFGPLQAGWTRRGEMGTLIALESAGARLALTGQALWCGLYANELLLRLLPRDDPAVELFAGYHRLLTLLAAAARPGPPLRRFELALLEHMGVAPDLGREAETGRELDPEGLYHLRPEAGLVTAGRDGDDVFSGRTALALAAGDEESLSGATGRSARGLMRRLLDFHLGDRPLKTRALLEQGFTHGDSTGRSS